jgi:hypothetical protein
MIIIKMPPLKKVTIDDLYDTINSYVSDNKVIVEDYTGMVNVIISMIKGGHCFVMDRDILRDAMESLTYMYAPSDEMNKDRLLQQFVDEDDEDDEEESDEGGDFGNMDMLRMMQMMGGGPRPEPTNEEVVVTKETDERCKECPTTGNTCEEQCKDGECKADESLIPGENVD